MAVKLLQYPHNIGTTDATLPSWIQFLVFRRTTIQDSVPISTINLYMPNDIRMPSSISWGTKELGAVGAALSAHSNGVSAGAYDTASRTAMNIANNILGKAASNYNVNYDLAKDAASVASGTVLNPYLTAIFNGVDFRDFAFRFTFSPHMESDCQVIDDIIKEFRMASLPTANSLVGQTVLDYPHEVQINYKFKDGGENHPWLKNFRRSVITSIDIDYGTGNSWTTFRNGFPTMIQLDLRFKEIQLVLREDVERGF